jgi:hypothetical protein
MATIVEESISIAAAAAAAAATTVTDLYQLRNQILKK